MARLSKQKIKQIVKHDMPGYTVVEPAAGPAVDRPEAEPDAVSAELDELRRQFFGNDYDRVGAAAAVVDSLSAVDAAGDSGGIVLTRPAGPAADAGDGPGPKAVVISKGKVVAAQG